MGESRFVALLVEGRRPVAVFADSQVELATDTGFEAGSYDMVEAESLAGTCETESPAAEIAEEALPVGKTEVEVVVDTSVEVVGPHDVAGFAIPLVTQQASGIRTELIVDTTAVEVEPHRVAGDVNWEHVDIAHFVETPCRPA